MRSWPAIAGLSALTVGLVVAFLKAPAALLSGAFGEYAAPAALESAVARALAAFWGSGRPALPPELATLVDYWFWWHAIKVVICVALIVTLCLLARVLWSLYVSAPRRGALTRLIVATLVSSNVLVVLVVLLANLQSALTPLVALLQVLPGSGSEQQIAPTLTAILAAAGDVAGSASAPPALGVLLGDLARYHWMLAAAATAAAAVTATVGILFWRRRARTDPAAHRVRRMCVVLALVAGVATLLALGIAVVSIISALDPVAALTDVL